MSQTDDLSHYLISERRAREQAEETKSISARISHLARADEYARKAALLRVPINVR